MLDRVDPRTAMPTEGDLASALAQWLHQHVRNGGALRLDSRAVTSGDAFFALPGTRNDGRSYIDDAIAHGARAVLIDAGSSAALPALPVPSRVVPGLRMLAGPIASRFHDSPSDALRVVAVTGTNGKTSTSHWIAEGMHRPDAPSAVVGTIGSGVLGSRGPAGLTTPDALSFQSMLADYRDQGADVVAVEASSIGLDQGRLEGTSLDVAVFTNLTRDHLDYHQTMADYGAAKARLFGWPRLHSVVINGDDPFAPTLLEQARAARADGNAPDSIVYGVMPGRYGARGGRALIADRVIEDGSGVLLAIGGDFGNADLRLSLVGRFNASNALAVAGTWLALGMPFDQVAERLEALRPIPGRMQTIDRAGAPLVVVDYAHTPDALANVLAALRGVANARGGRLWCVFGAGGDRDPGKRPIMGLVAERSADRVVVTSDNPRSEEPFHIISDIRAGLTREPAITELDRARAIERAILEADAADIVLVAGKGHEDYQEIAGVRHPFSDERVARRALDARAPVGRTPDTRTEGDARV
jgi:UDP-N-acetylmuramyl-tripeptide synthetase